MKKTIFVLAILFVAFIPCVSAVTYHTHEEINQMFKDLVDEYGNTAVASYSVIGQSTAGQDIFMFKIGNPNGGRILFDGCLHAREDLGSELAYLWSDWLLNSGDAKAEQLLDENCWMIIPVMNPDGVDRGNANSAICPTYGVDLNRNFITGWCGPGCTNWAAYQDCGNVNNGLWGCTNGPSAGSEVETQVLKNTMNLYKPTAGTEAFYISTHLGGGPYIQYRGGESSTFWTPVRDRTIELWGNGQYDCLYPNYLGTGGYGIGSFIPTTGSPSGNGYSTSDSWVLYGYQTVIIETYSESGGFPGACDTSPGTPDPSYQNLVSCVYPIYKAFFIAASESVGVENPNPETVTCYQCNDGTIDTQDFPGTECPTDWSTSIPTGCAPTPGFEFVFLLSAIAICLIYLRWKK
jgi:hypothetical protein